MSTIPVHISNDVRIYHLTAGRSTPEWQQESRKRSLRYDETYRKRLELLQGLEFPTASTNVKFSADGQFLMSCGVYKPSIMMHELHQLSAKFQRHLDADVVQCQFLSEDYSKLVFLCSDRSVEFHAQFGRQHRTRIPRFGRDLAYHFPSCDLYVAGAGPEIYRLNLEQGRFLAPMTTASEEGNNTIGINPIFQLIGVGGENGVMETWDVRQRKSVGSLQIPANDEGVSAQISTFRFYEHDGLSLAVGTSDGRVLMYDLRRNQPLFTQEHHHGTPIVDLKFLSSTSNEHAMDRSFETSLVSSCDSAGLRLWSKDSGALHTAWEVPFPLRDVAWSPASGLVVCAVDAPRLQAYYIPSLGKAPRWAAFLDNLTDELEESAQTTQYEDYEFVAAKDMEHLHLKHLIGTALARPHMHGYYLSSKLVEKARALVKPFSLQDYQKEKIAAKLAKEQESRIRLRVSSRPGGKDGGKNAPAVNAQLSGKVKGDARFAQMFADKDFEVVESAKDKQARLAREAAQAEKAAALAEMGVFEGMEGDDDSSSHDGSDASGASDDSHSDGEAHQAKVSFQKKKKRLLQKKKKAEKKKKGENDVTMLSLTDGRRKSALHVDQVSGNATGDLRASFATRLSDPLQRDGATEQEKKQEKEQEKKSSSGKSKLAAAALAQTTEWKAGGREITFESQGSSAVKKKAAQGSSHAKKRRG
jgi:ribosome biogenesis protein ENP2